MKLTIVRYKGIYACIETEMSSELVITMLGLIIAALFGN